MRNKWQLTHFEKAVLSFTLAGESDVLRLLRHQSSKFFQSLDGYSGVGVSLRFYLNRINLKRTSSISGVKDRFQITDVVASINGGEYLAGAALFIDNGFIDALTMSNFLADSWPSSIDDFQLDYSYENNQRDLAKLFENWNIE